MLFALCVLAHELGHTAVSLLLRHPVRRVVIFLLGGVSEIEREPDRPRDEFLIAAAGPLVSVVLAALAALGYLATAHHSMLGVLLLLLTWANGVVVVFNVLPGLPLDGGRLVRAAIWALTKSRLTGTLIGAWAGRVVAVGVFALFLFVNRGRNRRLLQPGRRSCSRPISGSAAGASLKHARVLDRVPRARARDGCCVPDCSCPETCRSTRRCAGCGRAVPAGWSWSTPSTARRRSWTRRA